jgi:hypothetical protein
MKLKLHLNDVETIFTKEEMVSNMDRIIESISEFYGNMPPEKFFASPANGGWSPEKNIRHLIKSTQPIYLGLMSPKLTLYIFGFGKEKSRNITEIKRDYLAKLNAGGGAGVFTPMGDHKEVKPEEQKKLVSEFVKLFQKYKMKIESWEETSLDKYNMPHPLLGNLTVREMLLFSIFHLFHHTEKVEARFN